jgi:hypothetical protein
MLMQLLREERRSKERVDASEVALARRTGPFPRTLTMEGDER